MGTSGGLYVKTILLMMIIIRQECTINQGFYCSCNFGAIILLEQFFVMAEKDNGKQTCFGLTFGWFGKRR